MVPDRCARSRGRKGQQHRATAGDDRKGREHQQRGTPDELLDQLVEQRPVAEPGEQQPNLHDRQRGQHRRELWAQNQHYGENRRQRYQR